MVKKLLKKQVKENIKDGKGWNYYVVASLTERKGKKVSQEDKVAWA